MALFKKAKKRNPDPLFALQLFNEIDYIRFHEDVFAAIKSRGIPSGFEHYRVHGIFEGRFPGFDGFSADEYLKLNPDVAENLSGDRKKEEARHHFSNFGFREGRRWRADQP
ncbi:hypothetical protein [Ensifer sp. Root127]|uniref:hypothetical protein n=1 Tax=Ensifer sp. Root127 TaxID=1736440 RepID=UPI00070A8E91|nr:hypothetical protein [Ensifer sp. Root127]KQW54800.1 hypothetical protein ASD03_19745 [Ensifer sp. Root127]